MFINRPELFSQPVSSQKGFYTTREDGVGVVLDRSLASLVEGIDSFATPEQHIKDWWQDLSWRHKAAALRSLITFHQQENIPLHFSWPLHRGLAKQFLEAMHERKLVWSREKWSSHFNGVNPRSSELNRISILTLNRPHFLEKCLKSYIDNTKTFGRAAHFSVYDHAQSREESDVSLGILKKLKSEMNQPLHYIGPDERAYFKQKASSQGIDPELVDFLFLGDQEFSPAYGGNRNVMLLDSVGDCFLSVDDDSHAKVLKQNRNPLVAFDSSQFHQEFKFYSNRMDVLNNHQFEDLDLLSSFGEFLGQKLGDVFSKNGDWTSIDFSRTHPTMRRLFFDPSSVVLATFANLYGDAGTTDPTFHLQSMLRQDNLNSELLKKVMTSREIVKTLKQPIIDRFGTCMMGVYALDNRSLVAPFFPLFRMEDTLFGEMMSRLVPGSLQCHLPLSVGHLPEERKFASHHENGEFQFWPFHAFLSALKMLPVLPGADRNSALKMMGEHFEMIGSLKFSDYRSIMRLHYYGYIQEQVKFFDRMIFENQSAPQFWSDEIIRMRDLAAKNLLSPVVLAPREMAAELGQHVAETKIQSWIQTYGRAIKIWPDLWALASEMRAQKGSSLSRIIS